MDFKNLNFTDFVRYSLAGLNFILFVLLLPAIYFVPGSLKDLVSETSVLTILLFSLAIGYLMDMLKIYQFIPKFNKNKIAFRKQIAEALDIPVEQAGSYFSVTSAWWDENNNSHFERRRAEQVLVLHTAAALFLSCFVWIFFAVHSYIASGFSDGLYLPVSITIATLLLTVRLYRVGMREIKKDDQILLLVICANKKKIKEAWKLVEKK